MNADKTKCTACDGEGLIHTGIEEAPTTMCERCGGSGKTLAERVTQPAQDRCCEHDSDCAIHNAPAYPVGPCDCTLREKSAQEEAAAVRAVQANPHAATFPDEIWLQVGDCDEEELSAFDELYRDTEMTWCQDSIDRYDVRYVRADLASSAPAPDHETIVREDGGLICTACGTTAPAPQPQPSGSIDSNQYFGKLLSRVAEYGFDGGHDNALIEFINAWKNAACAVAREEGLRSIPAGHHPDCTELRRQDHEQACRVTNALMAERDSYRQRVAIAEEAWRAAKTRADQADEDAEREKEFSHYMETRARADEAKLVSIQSQAAGDKPTGCTHNCNQGRNCTCG